MSKLKKWVKLTDSDSGYFNVEKFNWKCYGKNAFSIDYNEGNFESSITFDILTSQIYEALTYDKDEEKAWRWINPKYEKKVKEEHNKRGWGNFDIFIDCIIFKDVDSFKTIITKFKKLKKEKQVSL